MKLNYVFLTIGIVLSVISKVLQLIFEAKFGDVIVIFAAVFFVLAIAFSIDNFKKHYKKSRKKAAGLLAATCLTVMSFQLMMIFIMGNNNDKGFYFLIPLFISGGFSVYRWFQLMKKHVDEII